MDFELPDEQTMKKMNAEYADMLKNVEPLSLQKQTDFQNADACARSTQNVNNFFILYFIFYLGYNLGYGTAIHDADRSMGRIFPVKRSP